MRVLLVIFILLGGFPSLAAEIGCEAEANPAIASLVQVTRTSLTKEEITPSDLQLMIDGELIANPFLNKPRGPGNLHLSTGMTKAIRASIPHLAAAKAALIQLQAGLTRDASLVQEAKVATEDLLIPTLLTRISLGNRVGYRTLHWHRKENGELELVVYFQNRYELLTYSPYSDRPLINRVLISNWNIPDKDNNVSSLLSASNGKLYVAAFGQHGVAQKLLVHDVSHNQNIELDVPDHVTQIKLFELPNGKLQVVTTFRSQMYVYELGMDGLAQVYSTTFPESIESFEIVKGPGSRMVLSVAGERHLHLIDLMDHKVLRKIRTSDKIVGSSAILLGDSDYAIAVQFNTQSAINRTAFITSNSPHLLWTAGPKEIHFKGTWHLTRDGRALFPIGISRQQSSGTIEIYEPMKLNFKSGVRLFPPGLERTLIPEFSRSSDSFYWARVQLLETSGHLYAGFAFGHEEKIFNNDSIKNPITFGFTLYSLDDNQEIYSHPVKGVDPYSFHLSELNGRMILTREVGQRRPIEIIDLTTQTSVPHQFGEAPTISTLTVRNRNGDELFASDYLSFRDGAPIDILRLIRKE